jgi:N-methylhydantoinase A
MDDEPIEVVSLRAGATVTGTPPALSHRGDTTEPTETRAVQFESEVHQTPVYDRERLPVGATLAGPAIYEGGESTVVVPPAWRTRVDDRGTLVLEAGS